MKKQVLRKKVLLNEFHQKYNERTVRKISVQPPVTPDKAVEQYWKVKRTGKEGFATFLEAQSDLIRGWAIKRKLMLPEEPFTLNWEKYGRLGGNENEIYSEDGLYFKRNNLNYPIPGTPSSIV